MKTPRRSRWAIVPAALAQDFQCIIAQSIGIAFAAFGTIDDSLGRDCGG
jgi:hypothetical protein